MGIGTPFTVASTATRHMLDANVTFGQSSDRFNARDRYRRTYRAEQRLGAGLGSALGVALPVSAGIAWLQRGLRVPGVSGHSDAAITGLAKANPRGLSPGAMQAAGRVAGIAALGLATAVGVRKTVEITQDDGNLGAAGAATGVLAGAAGGIAVGKRFGGKIAAVSAGLGALAGGVAGGVAGRAVRIGDGNIGKEHAQAAQVDAGAADRVRSFARGGFNHFNEVGPATQGISFGYRWGMREAVQKRYSNAERAGAMHGDLLAAGILGSGALAIAGGLAGVSRHATAGVSGLKAGADIAGHALGRGVVTGAIQRLGNRGALGVGAAAAGIAGVVAAKEWDRAVDVSGGDRGRAAIFAGGALAATAGTAALVSRSAAMQGMVPANRAASSALVAAALIGVLSSARLPLQQFMNDAKDATAANGGVNWTTAGPVGGVAAAAGGYGAMRGLSRLIPDGGLQLGRFHIPKLAVVGAGTAISAAAMGGVGVGLSATMPDLKTIGISAAGGAAAGAAFGGFARGVGVVPGIIGGAAVGISASALLRHDKPAAAEPTPQDVAGSIAS